MQLVLLRTLGGDQAAFANGLLMPICVPPIAQLCAPAALSSP